MSGGKKHNLFIIIYLVASALIFASAVYLGAAYWGEVRPVMAETGEIESDVDTVEVECGTVRDEPDRIESESDTETVEESEIEPETETEFVPTEPEDKIVYLFENAPYRWARRSRVDESDIVPSESDELPDESIKLTDENSEFVYSETVTETEAETIGNNTESFDENEFDTENEDELVLVYPKVAYAYCNLITGDTFTYNADEILYSASLIKAPYVYAVLEEIEKFEQNKHDYDVDVNPLYDVDGNPLFEGKHPNYDENGNIIYLPGEEKYNLDEVWTFDKENMNEEGSGEIQWKENGFQLTWRELFDYTILYSDNVAFRQIRDRFGYSSFYTKVWQLGIEGTGTGFMNLSANDCIKFLSAMYIFFEEDGKYAEIMKNDMVRSMHTVMISKHYRYGTVAHKYGWDVGAYHDMAIIYDDVPYLLVIMTDYEDGGSTANDFIAEAVALTQELHEKLSADVDKESLRESREEKEESKAESKRAAEEAAESRRISESNETDISTEPVADET